VIEDCKNSNAVTVLVRGGNKMIVEEVTIFFNYFNILNRLYLNNVLLCNCDRCSVVHT
jgi:hypothetical protein